MKPRLDISIPTKGSRIWRGIVWHHSASADGITRDWDAIRRYHTSYRIDGVMVLKEEFMKRRTYGIGKTFEEPWKDIGYHGGTELVDGKPEFNWGRPLSMIGSHAGVKGKPNTFNSEYIGICCVGNYDHISPDPQLWEFNLRLTRSLMDAFSIQKSNVIGHREVYDRLGVRRQKSCPGNCWNTEIFRAEI